MITPKGIYVLGACLCVFSIGNAATEANPLRIIGTNLFDFSQVMAPNAIARDPSAYSVGGEVVSVSTPTSTARIKVIRRYYRFKGGMSPGMSSGDQLRMLAAASIRVESAGQLMSMAPEMQQLYEVETDESLILLTNAPPGMRVGARVRLFALRLTSVGEGSYYDYGRNYTGIEGSFSTVILVTPTGRIAKPMKSSVQLKSEAEERISKTLAFLRASASNGGMNAQFDLGVRYLNGDGVSQDFDSARLWLNSAKTNGHPRAAKLLEEMP